MGCELPASRPCHAAHLWKGRTNPHPARAFSTSGMPPSERSESRSIGRGDLRLRERRSGTAARTRFSDMERRAAQLGEFYGGPVWKAHREAANGRFRQCPLVASGVADTRKQEDQRDADSSPKSFRDICKHQQLVGRDQQLSTSARSWVSSRGLTWAFTPPANMRWRATPRRSITRSGHSASGPCWSNPLSRKPTSRGTARPPCPRWMLSGSKKTSGEDLSARNRPWGRASRRGRNSFPRANCPITAPALPSGQKCRVEPIEALCSGSSV
jgi:hypothetical protein